MKHPELIHHGAREGVTGSCHQLWMDENSSVLIDCGQFQGDDEAGHEDELALDFSVEGVKALIVTHAHRPCRAYPEPAGSGLRRADPVQRTVRPAAADRTGGCLPALHQP